MSAEIRTEHGIYKGQTVQSIVRRVYGNSAVIRHSRDVNSPDDGQIVKCNRYGGKIVIARLIWTHGEWNVEDTDY